MALVVVQGAGKDAIVANAINRRNSQQHCHWSRQLNPNAAAVNNNRYCHCQ
jgi:hypothetical protein